MSESSEPASSITDPILSNGNLPDAQVIDVLLSRFPLELRALVGADLRAILGYAIKRERARAATVAGQCAAIEVRRGKSGAIDPQLALYSARGLAGLSELIRAEPGSCDRCGGARKVRSGLAGPGGQPLLIDCPACAGEPEPGSASVAEISSAKPSDPG